MMIIWLNSRWSEGNCYDSGLPWMGYSTDGSNSEDSSVGKLVITVFLSNRITTEIFGIFYCKKYDS